MQAQHSEHTFTPVELFAQRYAARRQIRFELPLWIVDRSPLLEDYAAWIVGHDVELGSIVTAPAIIRTSDRGRIRLRWQTIAGHDAARRYRDRLDEHTRESARLLALPRSKRGSTR
ncbi:MAG: hypothetical protein ACYTF7_11350 [Planctomycetota bacterium]|jgi:hypothetical protein